MTRTRTSARLSRSESSHPNIYKALAHPLRMRLLTALSDRVASPKELSLELEEPLGNVAYHVRMLEDLDCIELVSTTPRRGAVEHHYRAIVRPFIGDSEWADLPGVARHSISTAMLTEIWRDVVEAQVQGTFDSRSDRHLTRANLLLDEQAWGEMNDLLVEVLQRGLELQAESAERIQRSGDGPAVTSKLAILHFEAAPESSAAGEDAHGA